MRPQTVAQLVTRIYGAAGRRAGETDFALWTEMLDDLDVPDSDVAAATRQFIRNTEPKELINIKRFRETLNTHLLHKRTQVTALGEPEVSQEQAIENLKRLRNLKMRFASA